MSDLFEFISIEYSFREINIRGAPLLGVAQEHIYHRPVYRPLAVYVIFLSSPLRLIDIEYRMSNKKFVTFFKHINFKIKLDRLVQMLKWFYNYYFS